MEDSQKASEGGLSENERKGKMAEESFKNFLNGKNIPFYYIDQKKETFSKVFHTDQIKRPDYIVFTDKGAIHIDVKYRTKYQDIGPKKEERFYLSQKDIETLFKFYNKSHTDTWVAFTNNEKSTDFFYAPIPKIYDYYIFITNGINERRSKDKNPEEFDHIYSSGFCPIIIPETFLYNCLSLERGFYKEPDNDFSVDDIEYHLNNAEKISNNDDKNIYPKGYCIKGNHPIPFNKNKPLCDFCFEYENDGGTEGTKWDLYNYCHKCGSDIELVEYARPFCKDCFDKICNNIRWGAH